MLKDTFMFIEAFRVFIIESLEFFNADSTCDVLVIWKPRWVRCIQHLLGKCRTSVHVWHLLDTDRWHFWKCSCFILL